MKKHRQKGFTLYELLITVLIIGVILTFGVPNLSDFTQNSRVTALANDLHGSFYLARSEAARAKQNVTICASADPFDPAASCNGTSFEEGWIIFLDKDGNIVRDAGNGENVLKAFPPADDQIDIVAKGVNPANTATYFSFAPDGFGRGNVNGKVAFATAMICDDRGNVVAAGGYSAARRLVVTPVGRSVIIRSQQAIDASGDLCP